jgi:CBS domain containing-hemolysin-like protein
VPETGTEVVDEADGLVFVVDEMDERRIVSVTVENLETDQPDDPAD